MAEIDLGSVLRMAHNGDPSSVPAVLAATAAATLGATDVVVYLVDFGQTVLEPLPDLNAHAAAPTTEDVATTMPGRAFLNQRLVTAERDDGLRTTPWSSACSRATKTSTRARHPCS